MNTKVEYLVVYPRVDRPDNCYVDPERTIRGNLNICCDSWKTNTAIRMGFCDLIYAGFGNHPGLHDGNPNMPFDSGDAGVNHAHDFWAKARIRSMSIGDLICIDPHGMSEWWLCDNVGFVILSDDEVTSWLNFPRKYGCDMFEVKQWMKEEGLDK